MWLVCDFLIYSNGVVFLMRLFPFSLIAITLLISLCVILNKQSPVHGRKKPQVVCTTTLLADMIEQIAGDTIEIISLMKPGIDPHLYKATENDMHYIANADLIIYQGLHLEGKMAELFKAMKSYKPTFAASKSLAKSDIRSTDSAECYDPHVWFSIPLWIKLVHYVTRILVENFPVHADAYRERSLCYCHELENIHNYVLERAKELLPAQRVIITAHDAFGYFGQTYGFEVIGLQGISTDADISTASVENLARYIADNNISTVFTELSIPPKSIEALQQAVARYHKKVFIGPELYTDSLGDKDSPASTYSSMMRYTIDTLVTALQIKE